LSDETKIARVYAEALFQAASEENRLGPVRRDLDEFFKALEESPQLRTFLQNEDLPAPKKTEILMQLTEGGEPLVRNFLRLIVDKDREFVLEEAYRLLLDLIEEAEGIVHVEMTTAVPVPAKMAEELRGQIERALKKKVELALTVDESILGGVRLRVGDRIAEATVRHYLDQLRSRLLKPTASMEVSVESAS